MNAIAMLIRLVMFAAGGFAAVFLVIRDNNYADPMLVAAAGVAGGMVGVLIANYAIIGKWGGD